MKPIRQLWILAVILNTNLFFVSCIRYDDTDEKQQAEAEFQTELDQAMTWAQVYGPPT